MRKYLLLLCFFTVAYFAQADLTYKAKVTSGLFSGAQFYNRENLEDRLLNPNEDAYRWYNRIALQSTYDRFSVNFNAIRSDYLDFDGVKPYFPRNEINETKMYQAYAQYKFDDGNIKLGRVMPFSRWYFSSVDGGSFDYQVNSNFSVSAFAGSDVDYGLFVDDDNRKAVGYTEIAYREQNYGGKVKYLYANEESKLGTDLFFRTDKHRVAANIGYDATNSRLFDAGLGYFAYLTPELNVSANYLRTIPISWSYKFYSEYIDRVQIGISYDLGKNYTVSLKQMLGLADGNSNYLTYLYLTHKYFYVGLNYLSGDMEAERLAITCGGQYSPMDNLMLQAGIASVDHMFDNIYYKDEQTYSSYFKVRYKALDYLNLAAYANYYHQNSMFDNKWRGGLTAQLILAGGGK
jgi:hypothetical protein